MSSTVTQLPVSPPLPTKPPAQGPAATVWAALRARLDEASTWAGIGGVALVSLDLLPGALPAFHAAYGQHGWAKMTALLLALLSFVVAIAKREGSARVAAIAQACEVLVEAQKSPGPRA